jgi:hypothetical protein
MYVVMPLWHRCRFGLETLSVKLTYGWAHAFALFDIVRRNPMGWTPTGAKARDRRVLWFRAGAALWGGGTAALLVAACLWQVLARGYPVEQFTPMLIFACIYSTTNARVILHGAGRRSGAWLSSIMNAHRTEPTERHDLLPLVAERAPSTVYMSQVANSAIASSQHTVAVAASNRDGHIHLTLLSNSSQADVAPADPRAPITARSAVGRTLSDNHDLWRTNPTAYSYQWQLDDSAASTSAAITGATGPAYALGVLDSGWVTRHVNAFRTGAGARDGGTVSATSPGQPASGNCQGEPGASGGGPSASRVPGPPRTERSSTHRRATVRFDAQGEATAFRCTRVGAPTRTHMMTRPDRHGPREAPTADEEFKAAWLSAPPARDGVRKSGGAVRLPVEASAALRFGLPVLGLKPPRPTSIWWLLALLVMGMCGGAGWRMRMQRRMCVRE